MDYSKYYTPKKIAETLVNMLDIPRPENIIDICCGSYNLLKAAKKRWKDAHLSGVDLLPHMLQNMNFICMDGRKYAIECKDKYDLILANPPFERLMNIGEYPTLYYNEFLNYSTSRLENEMLLANLRLLKNQGTLLIIMPNTFVQGDTNRKIRKIIGNYYSVKKIVKLPDDTFGSTKIKSYAVIIKNARRYKTKYYEITNKKNEFIIQEKEEITRKNVKEGLWLNESTQQCLLPLESYRGNISSNMFCSDGIPVLHISKKQIYWTPSIRYVSYDYSENNCIEDSDILISRIGKSAGCWKKYNGPKMLISDCLIVIKDRDDIVYKKIQGNEFFHLVKGVATPYITIKDFNKWYQTL